MFYWLSFCAWLSSVSTRCHQQVAYVHHHHTSAMWNTFGCGKALPQSWTPPAQAWLQNVPLYSCSTYICKHSMASIFQTSCIWKVAGILGVYWNLVKGLIEALFTSVGLVCYIWHTLLVSLLYYEYFLWVITEICISHHVYMHMSQEKSRTSMQWNIWVLQTICLHVCLLG